MSKNIASYWKKTQAVPLGLLSAWFLITFGTIFFAEELKSIKIFGWPMSFYMAAQGCSLIYLGLIYLYVRVMDKLDQEYGVEEGDLK